MNKIVNVSTYGEVNTIGYKDVLNAIPEEIKTGNFIDIGCGYGKLIQYIAEHTEMNCTGIEIDKDKIKIAKKILWSNRQVKSRINFLAADIQDNYKLVENADFIFMNSICWKAELVKEIIKISNCIILTNSVTITRNLNVEKVKVNCSWSIKPQTFHKLNTITNR